MINRVSSIIDEKRTYFEEVNDRIWEYTETRFQEYKSSDLLCSVLEGEGFKVEKDIGGVCLQLL